MTVTVAGMTCELPGTPPWCGSEAGTLSALGCTEFPWARLYRAHISSCSRWGLLRGAPEVISPQDPKGNLRAMDRQLVFPGTEACVTMGTPKHHSSLCGRQPTFLDNTGSSASLPCCLHLCVNAFVCRQRPEQPQLSFVKQCPPSPPPQIVSHWPGVCQVG